MTCIFPLQDWEAGKDFCKDSAIKLTQEREGLEIQAFALQVKQGHGLFCVQEARFLPVLNYVFCLVLYMLNAQAIKMQENK